MYKILLCRSFGALITEGKKTCLKEHRRLCNIHYSALLPYLIGKEIRQTDYGERKLEEGGGGGGKSLA